MSDLISRQGVFIPNITVEMFRNASLEGVEDLLASGEMEDISLPSAESEIIRCKDCKRWDKKWTNDWSPDYHYCPMIDGVRKGDFYCKDAERRTDE